MSQKNQTINELTEEFLLYLRAVRRSEKTIRLYLAAWGKLKAYMASVDIKLYNSKVGDAFLASELGEYQFGLLSLKTQHFVSKIEALADFQNTGRVLLGKRRMPGRVFTGGIGKTIKDFIEHRERTYNLSATTINYYGIYLHSFLSFLADMGIESVEEITKELVLIFISRLDSSKPAAMHVALNILRTFTHYLFESGLTPTDYARSIPRDNYKHQARLPSTFSLEEIISFLNSVDRSSPKGKRDYAIFLLALKLGLRSSDIAGLKFGNINWKINEFNFEQAKTGRGITLPILPEVGNAIIDYLKHGRPASEDNHCFLQAVPPYSKISSHDIANAAQVYLQRAGISLNNRRHGPHALRHCFASGLLNEATPLPVISEALGHTSSMSTMFYLRIDMSSLKQCALGIPALPFSFYQQKGGCHE